MLISTMKRFTLIAVVVAAVFSSSCTVFDRDHRRTLDWLDQSLTPSSQTARVLLLPVSIPVGVAGLVLDVALVNPVRAIDDAWADTVDVLWTAENETSLRRVLIAPLSAIATPIVFGFDWFWRCLWPLEPNKEDEA